MNTSRRILGLALPARAISWLIFLLALTVSAQDSTFEQTCLSFLPEGLVANSTRAVLEYVTAGTAITFPDNDPSCSRSSQVVSTNLCRVALSIATSDRSGITYEHWFPETWTGRVLVTGNGGIDGCVDYQGIAYGIANGFAASGTNNGHNGTGGQAFYQNPDVVVDYAWRALHTGTTASKELADAFYGRSHTKSYYIGCSGGGRQGIKAAEMFPKGEFDGIVAGSPAVNFNNLYSWRGRFFTVTGAADSANFIQADTWRNLIHPEILKQCDDIDGAADGIITDPSLCDFNPETVLCADPDETSTNGTCLNEAQVSIVRTIFSPYTYPNGTVIYPGMQPGGELMAVQRLYAGVPFPYSQDWFRYVVHSDPTWDPASFNINDTILAIDMNPGNVRTYPSDLSPFRDSGGKIISFHGGQDSQISGFNTERFYNHLLEGMSATPTDLDQFYRFFRIEGMFHCSGGPGAWVLGQGGGTSAAGIPFEPESNVLAAVVAWVENGTAPEVLRGTKFVNDTIGLGVDYVKDHCRYPLRNTFTGGDPKAAESWECRQVAEK